MKYLVIAKDFVATEKLRVLVLTNIEELTKEKTVNTM